MEIIFELLFETIGQLLLQIIFELGFRGAAKVLSNRIVQVALGIAAAIGGGFAGGHWWGSRLSELGREEPPSSLWVSIALAAVFLCLAIARRWAATNRRSLAHPVAGGRGGTT